MTGNELRDLRREKGLTQAQLARLAGIGRHAVIYWEAKAFVSAGEWAPQRMTTALGVSHFRSRMRARGDGVLSEPTEKLEQHGRVVVQRCEQASRPVTICGAMTRKARPCRNHVEHGRTRCKFHGGMSTGPRSAEGKARIAEAQKRRWREWRLIRERAAHRDPHPV